MDIKSLFRARQTVIEMLGDRGYDITEPLEVDFEEYKEMFHTDKIDIHIVNETREIFIKFLTAFKTKPNYVRNLITEIKTEVFTKPKTNLVIITISKPNNTILKIKNEYEDIEFFWLNRLIINITRHQYVPLHERLDVKKIPEIMEKFNLSNIRQLPLIDRNDPVCRYYNFLPGEICKITRKNKCSGISIIYRLVK